MPISIPESVYNIYFDVIDSTINTIFGVTCQLVFIEQKEEISNTFNNIPSNPSINAHRKDQDQFSRGGKTFKETERLEDLKIKVYWDKKSWVHPFGNIVIPDGAIQTIGFMTDLPRVERAKCLIAHKDIKAIKEMRFKRWGRSFPMGLRQTRYFGCFWEPA